MFKPTTSLLLLAALAACNTKLESDSPGEYRSTRPADQSQEVDVDDHVIIIFNEAVKGTTVSAQAADGPCTADPIAVSTDDFASCVGGVASVIPQSDRHKIDWAPAVPLKLTVSYKLRVSRMEFDDFEDLADPVTISFTTAATVSDGVRDPDNQ